MIDEPKLRAEAWGGIGVRPGPDRTIITLTVSEHPHAAAKVADAIRFLQKEYPGAEIQVRGLDGRGWEPVS